MFGLKEKAKMEAEIIEQIKILPYVLSQYIDKTGNISLNLPEKIQKIIVVASGSSYHCARFSVDLIEKFAQIETHAFYSSEFLVKNYIPNQKNTLYVFITQSGETSDTLKALERVKKETKLSTLCITNVENSTIWNNCDYKMACFAGIEHGIAATKSFSAQMLCFIILALKIIEPREDLTKYVDSLSHLGEVVQKTIEKRKEIKNFVRKFANSNVVMVTGDGISYAIAKEATLKIKETSYKNLSAYILGEFMHGHVAVLNNKKSVFIYISSDKISERSVNNILNIKKDYNPLIVIIGKSDTRIKADYHIEAKCENELQYLFSNLIIAQLIALETALKLHKNVDNPKGLHKVVVDKNI